MPQELWKHSRILKPQDSPTKQLNRADVRLDGPEVSRKLCQHERSVPKKKKMSGTSHVSITIILWDSGQSWASLLKGLVGHMCFASSARNVCECVCVCARVCGS